MINKLSQGIINKSGGPRPTTMDYIDFRIDEIRDLPARLKALTENLNDDQLDKALSCPGHTLRELTSYLAGSHLSAFIRFKLVLTGTTSFETLNNDSWATPINYKMSEGSSMHLLEAIHDQWVALLENIEVKDRSKTFYHRESKKTLSLKNALTFYALRGKQYLAQVNEIV